MKRSYLANALLSLCASTLLFACGGKERPDEDPTTTTDGSGDTGDTGKADKGKGKGGEKGEGKGKADKDESDGKGKGKSDEDKGDADKDKDDAEKDKEGGDKDDAEKDKEGDDKDDAEKDKEGGDKDEDKDGGDKEEEDDAEKDKEGDDKDDAEKDKDNSKDQDGGTGDSELGDDCKRGSDCKSGICRDIKAAKDGGVEVHRTCSSCMNHDQCKKDERGLACSPHFELSLLGPVRYFECSEGELGDRCQSQDHCVDGTMCAEFAKKPVKFSVCSECKSHSDCDDDTPLCLPDILKLHRRCFEEGSFANGSLCELGSTGDRACEDFCTKIDKDDDDSDVGICGECRTDKDCDDDESCEKEKGSLFNKCVED